MDTIKNLIEKALQDGRMTQRDLAAAVDVSPGTIGNILANIPPKNLGVLRKFAAYFKVDVSELLGGGVVREETLGYVGPEPATERLFAILHGLDKEEKDALLHCAELLERGDMEMRQGLIGQMKLLQRTMPKKPARRAKQQASG